MMELPLGFIGAPSMGELVMLGVIGVLIFGKDLPSVGRTLGRQVMQFRKSLQGITDELNFTDRPAASRPRATQSAAPARSYDPIDDRDEVVAPKFEPPRAQPREQAVSGDRAD
jgi:sec-independent protein translocase protein TatA